ncbi:hypothetical protein PLICRDRAFT_379712 [Plicaturopsis crispa FD-325 SS-3]|nr:hypothetical protein PLICRDRAFT_379712 [Plicaturopsis crispa FD-325 SS-3]
MCCLDLSPHINTKHSSFNIIFNYRGGPDNRAECFSEYSCLQHAQTHPPLRRICKRANWGDQRKQRGLTAKALTSSHSLRMDVLRTHLHGWLRTKRTPSMCVTAMLCATRTGLPTSMERMRAASVPRQHFCASFAMDPHAGAPTRYAQKS